MNPKPVTPRSSLEGLLEVNHPIGLPGFDDNHSDFFKKIFEAFSSMLLWAESKCAAHRKIAFKHFKTIKREEEGKENFHYRRVLADALEDYKSKHPIASGLAQRLHLLWLGQAMNDKNVAQIDKNRREIQTPVFSQTSLLSIEPCSKIIEPQEMQFTSERWLRLAYDVLPREHRDVCLPKILHTQDQDLLLAWIQQSRGRFYSPPSSDSEKEKREEKRPASDNHGTSAEHAKCVVWIWVAKSTFLEFEKKYANSFLALHSHENVKIQFSYMLCRLLILTEKIKMEYFPNLGKRFDSPRLMFDVDVAVKSSFNHLEGAVKAVFYPWQQDADSKTPPQQARGRTSLNLTQRRITQFAPWRSFAEDWNKMVEFLTDFRKCVSSMISPPASPEVVTMASVTLTYPPSSFPSSRSSAPSHPFTSSENDVSSRGLPMRSSLKKLDQSNSDSKNKIITHSGMTKSATMHFDKDVPAPTPARTPSGPIHARTRSGNDVSPHGSQIRTSQQKMDQSNSNSKDKTPYSGSPKSAAMHLENLEITLGLALQVCKAVSKSFESIPKDIERHKSVSIAPTESVIINPVPVERKWVPDIVDFDIPEADPIFALYDELIRQMDYVLGQYIRIFDDVRPAIPVASYVKYLKKQERKFFEDKQIGQKMAKFKEDFEKKPENIILQKEKPERFQDLLAFHLWQKERELIKTFKMENKGNRLLPLCNEELTGPFPSRTLRSIFYQFPETVSFEEFEKSVNSTNLSEGLMACSGYGEELKRTYSTPMTLLWNEAFAHLGKKNRKMCERKKISLNASYHEQVPLLSQLMPKRLKALMIDDLALAVTQICRIKDLHAQCFPSRGNPLVKKAQAPMSDQRRKEIVAALAELKKRVKPLSDKEWINCWLVRKDKADKTTLAILESQDGLSYNLRGNLAALLLKAQSVYRLNNLINAVEESPSGNRKESSLRDDMMDLIPLLQDTYLMLLSLPPSR